MPPAHSFQGEVRAQTHVRRRRRGASCRLHPRPGPGARRAGAKPTAAAIPGARHHRPGPGPRRLRPARSRRRGQEGVPDHRDSSPGRTARRQGHDGQAAEQGPRLQGGARRTGERPAGQPDARLRRVPALEPRRRRRARRRASTPLEPLKDWYDDQFRANRDVVRKRVSTASRASARTSSPTGSRRATGAGRQARRHLQLDPARARVDLHGDQPAPVQVRPRPQERPRLGHPGAAAARPGLDRPGRERRRLRLHVREPRARASGARRCATTTATA